LNVSDEILDQVLFIFCEQRDEHMYYTAVEALRYALAIPYLCWGLLPTLSVLIGFHSTSIAYSAAKYAMEAKWNLIMT